MTEPHLSDDANTSRLPRPLPGPSDDRGRIESWNAATPGPGWYPNPAVGAVQWWDGQRWAPPNQPQQPPMMMGYGQPTPVVIIAAPKSVGLAFLLAFLFGPFGMFYATVAGGLIMLVVSFFLFFVSIFTFFVPTFLCWVTCIVWACISASNSNRKSFRY